MTVAVMTRRSALLLPILLAACGDDEPKYFEPLTWDYLPPIKLNVATIEVQQRYVPSGISPDATPLAPVKPVQALTTMIDQRLRPFGTVGRAVVAIQDASLTRRDDVISGSMAVVLSIYGEGGARDGFVEARVVQRYSGRASSTRLKLYKLVKSMMDSMNVELEYQIRRNLRAWITEGTAASTTVEQTPLAAPTRR